MGKLDGKRAVITGGSSGIGLATAKAMIGEGARVAIISNDGVGLATAARDLGDQCIALEADAGRTDMIPQLRAAILDQLGPPDILFLNAGVARYASLDQMTEAQFDEMYGLHVKAPLFTVKALAPDMPDGSTIIFTSSNSARVGLEQTHIYASSKAAVRQLVRTLANELSARHFRVNAVLPGPIITNIGSTTGLSQAEGEKIGAYVIGKVPLGRFGSADELARTVLFLASADASYVNGTELVVDGGWTDVGR